MSILGTVNTKVTFLVSIVYFYSIGVTFLGTLNKIVSLLGEQKKTQKDLTDHIGLSKNAFTKWKNGENESYIKHINEIARFFDVSTDYLLGNTDIKKEPSIEEDAELRELLKKPKLKAALELLKQMDEHQLDIALAQVEALSRLKRGEEQ